jgi:hypothetical protein
MNEGDDTHRSLGDRIIRIGVIAGAIVTVLGLGRLLWPDPTPRLVGEIADVSIVTRITLAESVKLVSSVAIQESPSPSPSPSPTTSPSPSPTPTIIECLACPDALELKFEQVQKQLPSDSLPENCKYTDDGEMTCSNPDVIRLIVPAEDISAENGSFVASSKKLLQILDGTRSLEVSNGVTEPIGVAISFDIALEGFRSRRVDVRWSLFSAGRRAKVPQDWLVSRKALVAIPEANFDRESGEFWIPLPKKRGPYFARVSAWHQNNKLDFSDSEPFN